MWVLIKWIYPLPRKYTVSGLQIPLNHRSFWQIYLTVLRLPWIIPDVNPKGWETGGTRSHVSLSHRISESSSSRGWFYWGKHVLILGEKSVIEPSLERYDFTGSRVRTNLVPFWTITLFLDGTLISIGKLLCRVWWSFYPYRANSLLRWSFLLELYLTTPNSDLVTQACRGFLVSIRALLSCLSSFDLTLATDRPIALQQALTMGWLIPLPLIPLWIFRTPTEPTRRSKIFLKGISVLKLMNNCVSHRLLRTGFSPKLVDLLPKNFNIPF